MNQYTYLLCLPLLLGAAACPDRQGAASMNPAPRNIEQVDRGSPPGDPLRDTAALNQGDALRLKGHGVQLSAVPVRRVLSKQVFTIETKEGPEIFVVIDDVVGRSRVDPRVELSQGLVVNLFGVVQRAPLGDGGSERPVKGLSDTDAAALEGQRLYILAQEVKPQQR